MYLDQRTKKFLKVFALVAVIFVLVGCTSNLDKNGHLIASRAITESTPWSLSELGFFDFILTYPIARGILFISKLGNVAYGVVGMTIFINLLILPIMIKSTESTQKMQLLQPEMERIQRKYAGRKDQASQMRQTAEIQALYKKHNISMFSSFSTFLTLPIMLAVWQAVQRVEILYSSTLFGLNLGITPISVITEGEWAYIVIVALVGLTQYFAIEINNIKNLRISLQFLNKSFWSIIYTFSSTNIYTNLHTLSFEYFLPAFTIKNFIPDVQCRLIIQYC